MLFGTVYKVQSQYTAEVTSRCDYPLFTGSIAANRLFATAAFHSGFSKRVYTGSGWQLVLELPWHSRA